MAQFYNLIGFSNPGSDTIDNVQGTDYRFMKLIQLVVHLLPLETWENILSRIRKLLNLSQM